MSPVCRALLSLFVFCVAAAAGSPCDVSFELIARSGISERLRRVPISLLRDANPVTQLSFETVRMPQKAIDRDLADGVPFFSPSELQKCRVYVYEGLLYDAKGRLLHRPYRTMYVMDEEGSLYVLSPEIFRASAHHSSFFSGGAVSCAGDLVVRNGIIRHINNSSGHYDPRKRHLVQVLERLRELGADISEDRVFLRRHNAPISVPIDFPKLFPTDTALRRNIDTLDPDEWPAALFYCLGTGDPHLREAVVWQVSGYHGRLLDTSLVHSLLMQASRDSDLGVRRAAATAIHRLQGAFDSFN